MTDTPAATGAVLWDLDRTLADLDVALDDIRVWKEALQARFEPRGWDGGWSPMLPSLEAALDQVGASADERVAVYGELDGWEVSALRGVHVHDDVLRVCAALDQARVPQGIITNNGPSAAMFGLHHVAQRGHEIGAVAPRWRGIATRGADVRAKPAPDMLMAALSRSGVTSGTVAVVGDSPGDRAAASALAASWDGAVVFVGADQGALTPDPSGVAALVEAGLGALVA